MPKIHLTDAAVQRLKAPSGQRIDYFDTGVGHGFSLRVSGPTPRRLKGSRTFAMFYRFNGKLRRGTLGEYPTLGLGAAHDKARAWLDLLKKGIDPAAAGQSTNARAGELEATTVDELIDEYLERWARPRKRSAHEDERTLRRELIGTDREGKDLEGIDQSSTWRGRAVTSIARRDVVTLLDRIVDRGSPIQANRTLAVVRKMFNFAIQRGIVDVTPVVKGMAPGKERPRDRVLSDDEIRVFWKALDRSTMETNLRRALRFMLVTAQRKSEVIGMHSREVDRDKAGWAIPAERAKNGREHLVPLSPLALALVGNLEHGEERWIFPSSRRLTKEPKPYLPQSVDHATRDLFVSRRSPRKGDETAPPLENMERFTPHDLRRTAATKMRELGISKDDLKLVLNHKDASVTGAHYDRYDGLAEKGRALDRWAAHLGALLKTPRANVVGLRRHARK